MCSDMKLILWSDIECETSWGQGNPSLCES